MATVALLGVACTGASSAQSTSQQDEIRALLEAEFAGAYEDAAPTGRTAEVDLVADESSIDLGTGGATAVWAYDDVVPGPQIDLGLGDSLRVSLRNELPSPTSIHWHGIRVPIDMDGVPGLSQPAVPPGEEFVYEFTPPDPGTYWYHSHTLGSEQLDRGLYGAFVVADPQQDDAFDVDAVWMIDDWLLDDDGQIAGEFFDNHTAMHHGRRGELVTVNGDPDAELRVQPGERVRLRLVNASNGRWYDLGLDGLGAQVIAVDGQTSAGAVGLEGLTLAPGNRLDVVFEAPAAAGSYPLIDSVFGDDTTVGTVVVDGPGADGERADVRLNDAVPDWSRASELAVDVELALDVSIDDDLFGRYRMNGSSFPDVDPIHLEQGRFTKISIVNRTGLLHPIHLHGQFFRVLTRDGVAVDEPFFRDTILVDAEEVVEIGIVPLETGPWMLHCHIQEHADAGMATLALVREPGAPLPDLPNLLDGHVEAPLTSPDGEVDEELMELP